MLKIIQLVKIRIKKKIKKNTKAKFICSLTIYLNSKKKITTIGQVYMEIFQIRY